MRVSKDPEVRRQEIIHAARDLFLSKGYENTSVDDIVRRVNVAQGLFYYYFPKKEAILSAIADSFVEEVNSGFIRVLENLPPDFKDIISRLIAYYLNTIRDNQNLLNIATSSGTVVSLYVRQKLEDKAISELTALLERFPHFVSLKYPAYTIKILVRGLGDLYLEGVSDEEVMMTLIDEILGLPEGTLQSVEEPVSLN